jgi:hypothetical protein
LNRGAFRIPEILNFLEREQTMKRSNTRYAIATTIFSAIHVSSAFASCCLMPNYETTYNNFGIAQYTPFKQELAYVFGGTTLYFDGATVQEFNGTFGTPFDGCHFTGSAVPPQLSISGGSWVVGAGSAATTHYWGYDYLGWDDVPHGSVPAALSYYRVQRPAHSLSMPCNTTVIQGMEMWCDFDGSFVAYRDRNQLTLWIAATTVTNCRVDISSSACSTQTYP